MFGKCGVRTEKGPEETIISYNGGKKERNYKLMSQLVQEVKLKDSTYSLTSLVSMELHWVEQPIEYSKGLIAHYIEIAR